MGGSAFDTIRDQVSIADVARRFTELKRVGKRLKGRCLTSGHRDSSPSFYDYDDHAHCYGCGFHGDVVDLWAAVKGLQPGIEAALDLAREYGVTLPERDPAAKEKAEARHRKETGLAERARERHAALSQHPHVAEWWRSRGFIEESQERFLLGASYDGASAVFPHWNRGRVQGLISRQLSGEPKYLVPPAEEYPEGHKPLFIVGPHGGDIYLVEGFLDALAPAALGLRAAAVGGTGISERQKEELLRLKGTIYALPDGDEPGAEAGRAWARELYPRALLCPAEYGEGRKDVADLFAADGEGAKAVIERLKTKAEDALDLALAEAPKGSARGRYHYFRDVLAPLLVKIADEGERNAAADDAARALGLKAGDLRRVLKPDVVADETTEKRAGLMLSDPEPWPEPVDGAALLDEIASVVSRYLSATDEVFRTVALWVVYSHAFELFDVSPLLAIVSPEKRCGKTTLLTLLYALVPRPLTIANITPAALFRTVEKFRPTLLIDEADSFLTDNEELRGILNSGHRKATAYVIRTTGDEHEPRQFTTWTPKAIALIGALPGTLEDRSIPARLQRKRPQDKTERLRYDRLGELDHLRRQAARWVGDMSESLRSADPDIPASITNDRARDNWRPLIAIADAVGGVWPERAREVSLSLSSTEPDTESVRVLLLRDLKALFDEHGERLESERIVTALVEIEGHPWAEGKNGRPLTKNGLARLLRPFGIRPTKWRGRQVNTERGYLRADFEEVFARYLDSQTPQTPHTTEPTTYGESQTPQEPPSVAFADAPNSNGHNAVAFVAVGSCGNGHGNSPHPPDEFLVEPLEAFRPGRSAEELEAEAIRAEGCGLTMEGATR